MPGTFHTGVQLSGYHFEDSIITFKLATGLDSTYVGKAVALDTTANGTVKIPADGDRIFGILASFEDRLVEGSRVGAVELRFATKLNTTGTAPAVGVSVVGSATAGSVKAAAANPTDNIVVESGTGYVIVHRI